MREGCHAAYFPSRRDKEKADEHPCHPDKNFIVRLKTCTKT